MAKASGNAKKKSTKRTSRKTAKKSTRRAGGTSRAGASAKASTPGGTFKAPAGGMKIRMYRQGFGDCYLLAFGGESGAQTYVMIDMGVVYAAPGKPATMKSIASSIHAATGGHVDVLVITHEHYDHVCGFKFAEQELKKITFDRVWLAWTQDPKDSLAKSLHEEYGQQLKALRAAAVKLKAAADQAGSDRLRQFLSFDGELLGAKEDFSPTTKESLAIGASLAAERECYRPGRVIDDVIEGVRVYVMGPPYSKEKLKETEPEKNEAYLAEQAALVGFIGALSDGNAETLRPIDKAYAIDEKAAGTHEFFAREYFGNSARNADERAKRYDWRRIDASWLRAGESLALQMQNATNNTSLVLAFEHVRSGKVLLFAGDAQPGNWRSWKDVKFNVAESAIDRDADGVVTSDDLLAATVVYKVGHHGSHNGTMRGEGLEKMTSRDLVALLPTDKVQAEASGWDKIPKPELVERLMQRTQGRVLSADHEAKAPDKNRPASQASSQRAWQAWVDRVSEPEGALCYDVEV
ncbi:MAG: hypothetical protein U0638_03480 [Phycisphaerales bacterium]